MLIALRQRPSQLRVERFREAALLRIAHRAAGLVTGCERPRTLQGPRWVIWIRANDLRTARPYDTSSRSLSRPRCLALSAWRWPRSSSVEVHGLCVCLRRLHAASHSAVRGSPRGWLQFTWPRLISLTMISLPSGQAGFEQLTTNSNCRKEHGEPARVLRLRLERAEPVPNVGLRLKHHANSRERRPAPR